MTVVGAGLQIDKGRIAELAAKEEKRLNDSTTGSGRMYERAKKTMAGGVPSSYQVRDPWPIYLEEGRVPRSGMSMAMSVSIITTALARWSRGTRILPS